MHGRSWRSFVLTSSLLAIGGSARAAVPLGDELQVNSLTEGFQRFSAVAPQPGGFVVVWTSYDFDDLDDHSVLGQRFDSLGGKLGPEFQVNSYTPAYQQYAKVGAAGDGSFVVVWQSRNGQDGGGRGVFGQRFDSSGARLGGEFQINTTTTNSQRYPAVAVAADGDFVVVWGAHSPDVFGDVHAQRFASSGGKLGELLVNSYTVFAQFSPEIAMRSDGDFVVVWTTETDPDGSFGVRGQLFDSGGAMIGVELQISSYTGPQAGQAIAMDADGDFVVVWTTSPETFTNSEVVGQRFDSSGTKQGPEFQVNSSTEAYEYTTFSNWLPRAVAMESDGDFVVVWTSYVPSAYADSFGQRFASNGDRLGGEFQINEHTVYGQYSPAVSMLAGGEFVVSWQSAEQDGDGYGVFARRFGFGEGGPVLDIDGNGAVGALTDGLLLLRNLSGFSGAALTSGAVAENCTRCDSDAVDPYIAAHLASFDIDDSGEVEPGSDGVLVLRDLFGFTGDTLIGDAPEGDCMRCDAPEIEAYLDTLK